MTANCSLSFLIACTLLTSGCGGGGGSPSAPPPPPPPPALSLPASASVDAGQSHTVQASGGETPYTYSVLSGGGTIDAATGAFLAPSTAGTTVVRATDHGGATADETLTINPPFAAARAAFTIGAGTTQTVAAMGGQAPLSYSVLSGGGTVNSMGQYTAPATAGSAVVAITDALGTAVQITLTINPPLSLLPASTTLTASSGQSVPFLGQNGVPPYSYALASGPGSLTAQGVYSVGSASGSAVVRVTDSQGTAVTATVRALRIRVNGSVFATASDGTNLYVGGRFNAVNPYSAPHLLIADQTTGNPILGCDLGSGFMDGAVAAVATVGSSIYVAGSFNHYNGAIVGKLAKIDAATCALDTTFSRAGGFGSELGFAVQALAVSGGSLFVAGNFNTYRGTTVGALIKIDAATGDLDPTFISGTGANNGGPVAIVVSGNALYAGGYFTVFNGTPAPYIVKVDATTGAVDASFAGAPGPDGPINSLAFTGTSLYVGGLFQHYGSVATGFAKVDATSGLIDTTFSQNVANYKSIAAILPSGSSLYIAGGTNGGNTPAVAKIDATSGITDPTFTQAVGFNYGANALALAGSSLYVGGNFTSYNGSPAWFLAKLDPTTGVLDTTFTQATGGGDSVNTLATVGSEVVAGGAIATYRGQPAQNLAKFSIATNAVDTTFAASGGPSGDVAALAFNGGSLYVGGFFNQYQSSTTFGLAKVDTLSGVVDPTFAQGGGPQIEINALLVYAGALYVGGNNGSPVAYLAKVDLLSGTVDPNFGAAGVTNGVVYALAGAGTSLYVGGYFQSYAGLPAQNLAKVDLSTGALDQGFTQPVGIGTPTQWVLSLLASGSSLYAGGNFTSYRSASVSSLIKVDLASGALDTTFASAAGPTGVVVESLATDGTSLYAGGAFLGQGPLYVDNVIKRSLATGALDNTFYNSTGICTACNVNVDSLTMVGTQLFIGADAAALYRGTPAYFAFPVDSGTGALLDP
jgi:trimeric autotransporter adhesin